MSDRERIQQVLDEMVDDIYGNDLNTEVNMTFTLKDSYWQTEFNNQLYKDLTNQDLNDIEEFIHSLDTNNISLITVNDHEKYLSFLVNEPSINEDDDDAYTVGGFF